MQNLNLNWSRAKVSSMERSRGPISGVVVVLVSQELGCEYATVMSGKSVESILETLPKSTGVYAAMPSCNPEKIVSQMLSLWDDESLTGEPYTVISDGMAFHKVKPDNLLCDIRTSAWELFAEQNLVKIVESWDNT